MCAECMTRSITNWELNKAIYSKEIQAQYDEEATEFKVFFAPYMEAIKDQIGEESDLYIALLESAEESDKVKPVEDKELISKIMACNDYGEYRTFSKAIDLPEGCLMNAFLLELFHSKKSLFQDLFRIFSNNEIVKATLTYRIHNCSTAYSEIVDRAFYLRRYGN